MDKKKCVFSLQISAKGYISFDRKYRADPKTFPRDRQADDENGEDIVAPYLAFTKGWSNALVHFSHFKSTDQRSWVKAILQEAKQEVNDFEGTSGWEPSDVIVISWNGTVPDNCEYIKYSCLGSQVRYELFNQLINIEIKF